MISTACPSFIRGCPLREITSSGNEYSVKVIPADSRCLISPCNGSVEVENEGKWANTPEKNDKRET